MRKNAIIDTSVLICLNHLDFLKYLNLLYNKVFVPREVEREFLRPGKNNSNPTKRYIYFEKFYLDNSIWFVKCTKYRQEIIDLYMTNPKLDLGESEVFAQNQELGNKNTLLLDENAARNFADKNEIAKNGVLYILAILDLKLKICNYFDVVNRLIEEQNSRFSIKIIQEVYKKCEKEIFKF